MTKSLLVISADVGTYPHSHSGCQEGNSHSSNLSVYFRLYLSRNKLTSDSLALLAEVIEFHDDTTHLDVSWNNFYKPEGML